jgi:hypothetical protein
MNKKLSFIVALGTVLAVTESQAQNRQQGRGFGPPPGGERGGFGGDRGGFPGGGRGQRPSMMSFMPVLKALDADGNGEISSKEIENAAAALKKLDQNGDGKLTEDELRPQGPPGGRSGFGGGRPEGGRPEGEGFGPPRGDFEGGRGDRGDRGGRGDMDRRRGFEGGVRDAEGGAQRRPDPADMVKRLMAFDKNGDGKLAKDELSSRMQGLLDRADKNGDGFADEEELMNLAKGMGEGRGRGGFGDREERGGQREGAPGKERPRRPEFDN